MSTPARIGTNSGKNRAMRARSFTPRSYTLIFAARIGSCPSALARASYSPLSTDISTMRCMLLVFSSQRESVLDPVFTLEIRCDWPVHGPVRCVVSSAFAHDCPLREAGRPRGRGGGGSEEGIPHQRDFASTSSFEKAPDPHEHCRQLGGAPGPSELGSRRAGETKASGRIKNAPDRRIRGVSTLPWTLPPFSRRDSAPDTHPSERTGGPPNGDRSGTRAP